MLVSLLGRLPGLYAASAALALLAGCSDDSSGSSSSFTSSSSPDGHSVTINWRAPAANADGSPLMDLAGFRIQHGTRSNAYSRVIDVPSATTTSLKIDGLADGTHFFAVIAYNRDRVDGVASPELAIRLP